MIETVKTNLSNQEDLGLNLEHILEYLFTLNKMYD